MLLLLALALVALIVHAAWHASRSHAATAEHALREYAEFAAWRYASQMQAVLYTTFAARFSPVSDAQSAAQLGAAAPAVMARAAQAMEDACLDKQCSFTRVVPATFYFRLELATGAIVTEPAATAADMRAWVAATVARHARGPDSPSQMVWTMVG